MNEFSVVPELRIGSIVEVSGAAIRLELDGAITELTRTYCGRVYPIGQFASVIKIHYGRVLLFAYVRLLRMRSELERQEGHSPIPASEDSRIIEADLFAEGTWQEAAKSLAFSRGVRHYPLPGQAAYLTTQEELQILYERAEGAGSEDCNPMIALGTYVGAESTTCYANMDKLFGLHCAVLGSTGAGKSGTVAAIIHSVLQRKNDTNDSLTFRPRIIVLDPHGEYANAFGARSVLYRAYNLPAGDATVQVSRQLHLPYWIMTGEEFRDLVIGKTEWEATSEHNIVYKALTHSRLFTRGLIEASTTWQGPAPNAAVDPAEPRPIRDDEGSRSQILQYDRDTPDPFSLHEFARHITDEQGVRIKGNKWEPLAASDFKAHASVLDKLAVLRTDPRLAFMMKEYERGDLDLPQILEQFVGEIQAPTAETPDIRIVDISGLPNEIAGPLTAAIARLLFQYKVWQTREERERDPVLLICEEAHRYVPDAGLAEYQSAQKSIRRIAKEGRKYGLGLMLVSQRPADVERTVLSQCNSWIIMRLTNASDQEHVNRFLPDNLAGLSRLLPSLSRQEAIFVGEAAALPTRVIIRTLDREQLPHSEDVPFSKGWAQVPVSTDQITQVVKRWRKLD